MNEGGVVEFVQVFQVDGKEKRKKPLCNYDRVCVSVHMERITPSSGYQRQPPKKKQDLKRA